MFFGLAIGIILFLFLARIVFIAFIAAGIMSLVYAVFRRLKDFITYDSYGEPYIKRYEHPNLKNHWNNEVEPLFPDSIPARHSSMKEIQFIKAV